MTSASDGQRIWMLLVLAILMSVTSGGELFYFTDVNLTDIDMSDTSEVFVITDKKNYEPGEDLFIYIYNINNRSLSVRATDSNNNSEFIDICPHSCTLKYTPSILVQGEYLIEIRENRTLIEKAEVYIDTKPLSRIEHNYTLIRSEQGIMTIKLETKESGLSVSHVITDVEGRIYLSVATLDTRMQGVYISALPMAEISHIETTLLRDGKKETMRYNVSSVAHESTNSTNETIRILSDVNVTPTILKIKDSRGSLVKANARMIRKTQPFRTQSYSSDRKLEITFDTLPVKRMVFNDVSDDILNETLYIERLPLDIKKGAVEAYAIDPEALNFSTAQVTATATGKLLFKCAQYNFTAQVCTGNWTEIMRLQPGQNYTFSINATDPAFAEFDETFLIQDCYVREDRANNIYNSGILRTRRHNTREHIIYMKWDLSNLPANIKILDATLGIYQSANANTPNIAAYHVYDDTWDGNSETSMTWNNQVCGAGFVDAGDCNLTYDDVVTASAIGWKLLNVTQMAHKDISQEDMTLSIALRDPDPTANNNIDTYQSAEGVAGQRPYLNVTYIFYPDVTLILPPDGSVRYQDTQDIKFKVKDDTDMLNCTIWTNVSGWEKVIFDVYNNTPVSTTINVTPGEYTWNVLCNDSQGLSAFASSNRTFVVIEPNVTADASTYIVDTAVGINGTKWPSGNMTLIISDPDGLPVLNKTYFTSLGKFDDTWLIPVGAIGGNYTVASYQTNNTNISDQSSFIVKPLIITTDKTNYVKDEAVDIVAGIFGSDVNVTLQIINPFQDPAQSPKIILSNSTGWINYSWTIPTTPILGTYTLNATEDDHTARSVVSTFDVVTAVVQSDKTIYEQGETVNISGYSWDTDSDVSINITDPDGGVVYPVHNRTSNSTGHINDTWTIPYNATLGDYNISAVEPSDSSKTDDHTFTVIARPVTLTTDYTWYKEGETVQIEASGFVPINNVTIDIYNSTGSISGYPKESLSNSTGGFTDSFLISGLSDAYTISTIDTNFSNLNASSTFDVVVASAQSSATYGTGDFVTITGQYWDRSENAIINVTNSTGHLVYTNTVMSSSNGDISDSFLAPLPNGTSEVFDVVVYKVADDIVQFNFTVLLRATLDTDRPSYLQNEIVNITGEYYTPDGDVLISIRSLITGTYEEHHPVLVKANSTGGINLTWNISDSCIDKYLVEAIDVNQPGLLFANETFKVKDGQISQFYDGFESGSFATEGWSISAGPVIDSNGEYNGTEAAHMTSSGQYIRKTINLSGKTEVNLSYVIMATSFEGSEHTRLNIYDGEWHYSVHEFYTDDGVHYPITINLSEFNMINGFVIEFLTQMSGGGDHVYIDDVRIRSKNVSVTCTEFDSQAPSITNVKITPDTQELSEEIEITAVVTDNRNISKVLAIIQYPDKTVNYTMTDDDSNSTFNMTFTDSDTLGFHSVTIHAIDTSNNVDTQTGNFTIIYGALSLETDKQSYIELENVTLTGTGFYISTNVTITLRNSTSMIAGYPKTVISNSTGGINDTWEILSGTNLGMYIFNATQDSDLSRTDEITFDIVTAIIQSDLNTYEQGQTAYISGYNWDPDVDVTINITDPYGQIVYPAHNRTSNSTGHINDTWDIPYNATLGNYSVRAIEPSNPNKLDDYVFVVITGPVDVSTSHPWYKEGETVNITGYGFVQNNDVTIDIYNSSGSISGYPKVIKSNSTGGINDTFVASGLFGNFTLSAIDTNYSNLNASSVFEAVVAIASSSQTYGTGDTVVITGTHWDRFENVTINVTNSTGALVYTNNVSSNSLGEIIDSFPAPTPKGSSEVFNVTVYRIQDAYDISQFNFTTMLRATVYTDKYSYIQDETVYIDGDYYTPGKNVSVNIRCLSLGVNAEYYPRTVTANATGEINLTWNASDSCIDKYIVETQDQTQPQLLFANKTFKIIDRQVSIFYDGFETQDFGTEGWVVSNAVIDSNGESNGTWAAHMTSANRYIRNTVNLSGRTNVNLSFTMRATSFEGAEYTGLNIYDGTWNYDVLKFTVDDGVAYPLSLNLSEFNLIDNLTFEFVTHMSGGGDHIYIDDVRIRAANTTLPCTAFDSEIPSVKDVSVQGAQINLTDSLNITANVTDDRNLSVVFVTVTYPNGSMNLTMTDDDIDDIFNVTFTDSTQIGIHNITIYARDTSYNINYTETGYFVINDVILPNWSQAVATPFPATYAPGAQYRFNVSWSDDYELDKVWIEHNFTGSRENYSTSNASNIHYYDYSEIPAGSYTWKMFANDTSGNMNSTTAQSYTVSKNQSIINLSLNGTQSNITIESYTTINISAKTVNPISGIVSLYNNGTLINEGVDISNMTVFGALGQYNITAIYSQTQNYSKISNTWWVKVVDTIDPNLTLIEPIADLQVEQNVTFNVTVNATDTFIDEVWIHVWNQIIDFFREMFNIGGDQWQTNLTTNESFIGVTNYTIIVNDTSGQTTNLSENFTTFGTLSAITDKQSYLVDEIVYINGTGFNLNVNVSVDIRNSTNSVTGYPKNITSDKYGHINDTWTIPGTENLGTYTINLTDTTNTSRKSSTYFDIVTAVVEADLDTYEQGQMINISGYNWASNDNITLNITQAGVLVHGPINLTSNSSGWINHTWFIPYNASIGDYIISALQPSNINKTDTYLFSVEKRVQTLTANASWYKVTQLAKFESTGYVPFNNVTVDIKNSSGTTVSGYPIEILSNSSGGLEHIWNITTDIDNYTVYMVDTNYSNLNRSMNVEIVTETLYLKNYSVKNQDVVWIRGHYWDRNRLITVDIYNQTGGRAFGYPLLVLSDANGDIWDIWIAENPGIENVVYNISASHPYDTDRGADINITVLVYAYVETEFDYYDQNESMNITGRYYTAFEDVSLTIWNTETGSIVNGSFPVTTDAVGDFEYIWDTGQYCEATYTIDARDVTHPDLLFSQDTFEIDFYTANSTIYNAQEADLSGNLNNNNTGVSRTDSDDGDWLWFGSKDRGDLTVVEAWMDFTFNLSELTPEKIISMNFGMIYCHSGLQSSPSCGIGSSHEGITNGAQRVQILSNGTEWIDLTPLVVNETSDAEMNQNWLLNYPLTDYIQDGTANIRFGFNFTENESKDDLLMIDELDLNLTYRQDIPRNCTLVDDILCEANDIYAPGASISIDINGEAVNYVNDYSGLQLIEMYNDTQILMRYTHNFTEPLNLCNVSIVIDNGSVAINHSGDINFTLAVPLVDEQCNVLVCEGAMSKGECDGTNYTSYSEPVGGFCYVNVTGTWAQDAPDQTDFGMNSSDIEYGTATVEKTSTQINATVHNFGNTDVAGLEVEFYDKTNNKRIGLHNITLLNAKTSTILYQEWNATMGNTTIEIRIDWNNTYGEYNETNNNQSFSVTISYWQTYFGNVSGIIFINGSVQAFNWTRTVIEGNLYAVESGSGIEWDGLQALSRDNAGALAADDFEELDSALGMSGSDAINATFTTSGSPRQTATIKVKGRDITNIPVVNSTDNSNFMTGILWDNSTDTDDEYDSSEKENIIFVTEINDNMPGKFGTYDYEIRVPARLREYSGSGNSLDIYVEMT